LKTEWIFKITHQAEGLIDKFKAYLEAKGFIQIESISYKETFSPMGSFVSICIFITLVVHLDLELFQMKVKTACLNGKLKEEIYMNEPIGFPLTGEKLCL